MLDIHSFGFCGLGLSRNCYGFVCDAINRETLEHIWAGHTNHGLRLDCSCWCSHRQGATELREPQCSSVGLCLFQSTPCTIQVSCGTHCILIPQWSTWTQRKRGDALPLPMRKGGWKASPLQSPCKCYHSCRPWRQTAEWMWSLVPRMVVSLWGCLLHFPLTHTLFFTHLHW